LTCRRGGATAAMEAGNRATGTETEMNVRNCHQDGRYCLHRVVAGPRVAAILVPPDDLLFLFGTEF
jgi:hypothetical protein